MKALRTAMVPTFCEAPIISRTGLAFWRFSDRMAVRRATEPITVLSVLRAEPLV